MKASGKYFSVALAMLMLVMSFGITAHKMICLVSGAITISFFESEDCCTPENKNSNSVETKCCDFSTDYFKLDIQTLVSNFNFKVDLIADHFLPPCVVLTELTTQLSGATGSPPFFSGQNILILVSVFRI